MALIGDLTRDLPAEQRRGMDYSIAEGFFTTVATQFAGGFLTPYALSFGATKSQIALLSIVPNAMSNSLQIMAYRFTERLENRKTAVLLAMTATRLFWIPVALVPFFATGKSGIYALLLMQFLIAISQAFTVPAWTTIMGDLVPREIRGRFFATRNIVMNLGAVVAATVAGRLIAQGGFPRGYQVSIMVYFVLGMAGVYCFFKIRVPPAAPPKAAQTRIPLFATALNLKTSFGRYVSAISVHSFAVGLVSSLFNVYLLQELGGTVAHIGYMTAASTVATILGQRFWGPVIDRRGERPVMAVSAFTIAAVPALWLIATNPWQAVALNIFAGLAWSGWNLGLFNMLLVLSPESRRQAYVAVANSTPAIAGMISPLIAGVLADMFGIRPLLAASAIGRLSAAVLFWFAVAETTGARGQKATEPGGRGG